MTIANCPRCREQVSVPENASPEATVQCPLCQEEYSFSEAMAQLPPALIVVADVDQQPASVIADDDQPGWPALDLDGDGSDEAAAEDASPAAAFDFASGSANTGTKSKAAIRPTSRSRAPTGSPVKSIVSVVIGGLMAFPIAQLILWYLPGDLKRDFGAGPVVAQYVPQIVPARFRGQAAADTSDSETAADDSDSTIPDFNFGGTGEFAGSGAPDTTNSNGINDSANEQADSRQSDEAAGSNGGSTAQEPMTADASDATGADVFESPVEVPGLDLGGFPSIDEPADLLDAPNVPVGTTETAATELPPLVDDLAPFDPPSAELTGLAPGNVRDAPQVSADDVADSVQAAVAGDQAWNTDEASSPSGALKRRFYLAVSKLGEALTFVDQSNEQIANQVAEAESLLMSIGSQPDKLSVIGGVANGWIAAGHQRRTTDGICVYGIVRSVEPIGDMFETAVECAGKEIAIVSTADPTECFVANRQVLILGTILNDPTKNLGGYAGSRPVVVLDGYHVNVSAD